METRRAEFAGSWYPGRRTDCLRAIEELERSALSCPDVGGKAVGGIVPHAGWYYSGLIALSVIKCISRVERPDTCLIFGRHLHSGSRNFIMKEGAWSTPLGELEIDEDLAERLTERFPFTIETAVASEPDNTIELQLPFVKHFFPAIKIVPMGLPPRNSSLEIARSAADIAADIGRRTIVLGSTDLTHYGMNYGFTSHGTGEKAVKWVKEVNDRSIRELMKAMNAEGVMAESVKNSNACCGGAAGSAIEAARALGAEKAEEIGYYTSYDVRPDGSFVGYAGMVFYARA